MKRQTLSLAPMVAVLSALLVFEISSEDAWQLVLLEWIHLTLSVFFHRRTSHAALNTMGYILSECHFFSESTSPEKAKTTWR
jgi:hypothetical protein